MPVSILYALLLALISTLTPFLCYTKGLEGLEAGTASIIACIEPLVATLCGIIIWGDKLSLSNISGIILIFLSVILINFNHKKSA